MRSARIRCIGKTIRTPRHAWTPGCSVRVNAFGFVCSVIPDSTKRRSDNEIAALRYIQKSDYLTREIERQALMQTVNVITAQNSFTDVIKRDQLDMDLILKQLKVCPHASFRSPSNQIILLCMSLASGSDP